ncbi:MAG: glycosyltransferase [Campylobacteraceae bacterium]|jgi:glycosyltransferase involved in cell wall biosynthesis|nr:glycosyltransferase [Campylobacteraceae bacterium]
MKAAILESIVMPAGHEVEFDRILVDELKRQGHEPIFFVPKNFPFKIDYKTDVEYLNGGEAVSYAGAGRLKKIWLSLLREKRRQKWFDDAYEKTKLGLCDAIIIPTASFRFLRTLKKSKLKNSQVPVYFIFHGIIAKEKDRFLKQAISCKKYKNIYLKVMTLRDDFKETGLINLNSILPPIYKPQDFTVDANLKYREPVKIGFFGQFRREKNLGFLLDAFGMAKFNISVKLIVQGATTRAEDAKAFEYYIDKYKKNSNIEFLHKNLIGEEWQRALLDTDIIIMPYAAERYRYQSSAMLFTAIGFYKPVLQSPEINPEVLQEFNIGEMLNLSSVDIFAKQLERFVNNFGNNIDTYSKNLALANEKYSHENLIKAIFH